jgi:endonuclease YncB( thermonuclease family)
MRLFILILALTLCSTTQAKKPPYEDIEVVRVVSVYDGDTLRVDLACSQPVFCDNVPVRIRGIDTPEIRGKCESEKERAIQARNVVRALIEQSTKEGREVVLNAPERGKYFRVLADVHIDGLSVGKALINQGLARAYDGGKRSGWCD